MIKLMKYRRQHDWVQKTIRRTDTDDYQAVILCNCSKKVIETKATENQAWYEAEQGFASHLTHN